MIIISNEKVEMMKIDFALEEDMSIRSRTSLPSASNLCVFVSAKYSGKLRLELS